MSGHAALHGIKMDDGHGINAWEKAVHTRWRWGKGLHGQHLSPPFGFGNGLQSRH
jgi:hypothetical protein